MHSYCSNNAITLLKVAKSTYKNSIYKIKILKFICISFASQPASQPAVRHGAHYKRPLLICASTKSLEKHAVKKTNY